MIQLRILSHPNRARTLRRGKERRRRLKGAVTRSRWACFIVLCLFPGSPVGSAGQEVLTISTNYYKVTGSSPRELRAALNQARPWKARESVDARTRWDITWTCNVASIEGICRVNSFETRTTINLMLPRWLPPAEAPPELTNRWKQYIEALVRHEEGHFRIARAATMEMRKRVLALKEDASCPALTATINRTGQAAIDAFRSQEMEYDRKTEHGRSQGAHFP